MTVNPKKFQAMLVSKRKNTLPEDLTLNINDVDIKPNNSVKLSGITLDNKLNFENISVHFANLQAVIWMHYLGLKIFLDSKKGKF